MAAPALSLRLGAIYFSYFVYVGASGPYLSLYLAWLGRSAAQIGLLLGAMQCARIVAPTLWAHAAARTARPVRTLRLSLLLGLLILSALPFVDSLVLMAAVLFAQAICAGGAMPLVESLTMAAVRSRPAAYGGIRLWGSVGFICAVTLVGMQLDRFGVGSLIATLVIALMAALGCACTLADESGAPRASVEPWHALLRNRAVARLLLACFLMNVAHGPFYAFFSIHLASLDFSTTGIGLLWSVGVLAEISVFWLQPRWAGRWSMERVHAFSLACAVVRFALIALCAGSLPALLLAQLLHAATFGTWHVSALAILQRECPEANRGQAQALYMGVSFGAGGMIGSLLSGALWDALGAWTFLGAAGCALMGLLVFAGRGRIGTAHS